MELEELKQQWDAMNRKLDASLTLNSELVRRSIADGNRRAIRRLTMGNITTLVLNVLAVLVMGSVVAGSTHSVSEFVPALLLHLAAIGALTMSIHQHIALRAAHPEEPVVALQMRLERLRELRLLELKWILQLSPLLWILGVLVALRWGFGVDLLTEGLRGWVLANIVFGIAVIVGAQWASRRISVTSARGQRILDALAGRTLQDARNSLRSLQDFERG